MVIIQEKSRREQQRPNKLLTRKKKLLTSRLNIETGINMLSVMFGALLYMAQRAEKFGDLEKVRLEEYKENKIVRESN